MMDFDTATLRQLVLAKPESTAKPIDRTFSAGNLLAESRTARATLGRAERRQDAQRKERRRAAIRAQVNAEDKAKPTADPARLALAWLVVGPLTDLVNQWAEGRAQRARYHLGVLPQEIASDCLLDLADTLARSDRDLHELAKAARAINGEPVEEKVKGRRWLMRVINVIIRDRIAMAYRQAAGDGEELFTDAILAQLDTLVAPWEAHVAARTPVMLGGHPMAPGSVNHLVVQIAITYAITARHLDPLVEFMLADLRTDGAFPWRKNAREIFLLDPEGDGVRKWRLVVAATAHLKNMDQARATAARLFVRDQFAFLPGLIDECVDRMSL
jgi:hypothetical protein